MFLKKIFNKHNGQGQLFWALVESVRTARGPRHKIVSSLGYMDEAGRLGIVQAVEGTRPRQELLFPEPEPAVTPEWVEIDVKNVRTENSRRFGDVWLAIELIKKLGLDEAIEQAMPKTHPKISWGLLAQVLIIGRFCEPSSELYLAEQFYGESAMAELLGIPEEDIYDNRLYRALTHLVKHKDSLQQHLKNRLGDLFQISYELLLYDVTSTYFEGVAARNPQAQYGYSRDSRPDCKQVCIGLVVTKEAMPLGYERFEGNRHDSKTAKEIITKMESLYGTADRIWIMDRGMVSKALLAFLAQGNRQYIIGAPKSQLKKFEQYLLHPTWQRVHDGLDVQLCPSPDGEEREVFILCQSQARRTKERAMHDRFIGRFEQELQKVQKSCQSGRIKSMHDIGARIGRLRERYPRASALIETVSTERDGKIDLRWTIRNKEDDWSRLSEGCYLLRTNIKDWTAEDLWKAYIQLTDAEEAFRIQKQDLKLRPIWHQREDRVDAHILVCFLAFVLWKCLEQMCKQAGLGNEPRTIVEEIRKLNVVDVVLPTRSGQEIRLRCVSKPEKHLAMLLQKLNLHPPAKLMRKRNL